MGTRLVSTPTTYAPWRVILALSLATAAFLVGVAVWALFALEGVASVAVAGFCGLILPPLFLGLNMRRLMERQRITVDFDERLFIFEYFFLHDSFWPKSPRPRIECSFDDVLSVFRMLNFKVAREGLTVVTRHGTLHFTSVFSHYFEVRDALSMAASVSDGRGSFLRSPWAHFALGVAGFGLLALLALALGWI